MGGNLNEVEDLLACQSKEEQRALLGQLFVKHSSRLRTAVKLRLDSRLARRFGANDVLQETYVEAVQRLDEYLVQPGLPLFLWLRFLAIQRVKTLYRRNVAAKRRDVRREVSLEAPPAGSPHGGAGFAPGSSKSPSHVAMGAERVDRFRVTLAQMESADREIIFLRDFEELSWAEVARVAGLQEAAARQRHARAIKRLREMLRMAAQDRSGFWR